MRTIYTIITTENYQVDVEEWDVETNVLLFADQAGADDWVEQNPPPPNMSYLMMVPSMPHLEADAYSEAHAIIHNTAMDALSRGSMGVGAEQAVMHRVLDALRED